MSILDRALRVGEGKKFKVFERNLVRIADFEPELEHESDEELRARYASLRQRYHDGEPLDDLLYESFALTREAGKRTLGQRHFDVQMIGGMVLHDGSIAEMRTGEGKTLTATLPVVLNAIASRDPDGEPAYGKGVHLVTVNDYLARRDATWMTPIYSLLGVSVGIIQARMDEAERREAYNSDVTYGTNSEFGFDYLRDNLAVEMEQKAQRGHGYAIVDEVDNILIDEARTPLIISGQPEQAADIYYKFAKLAPRMVRGEKPEGDGGQGQGLGGRLRLRGRREAQDGRGQRERRREGREVPRHRQHVPRRARQPGQPPAPGAEGRGAVQEGRRLRGDRQRGADHRRVHRPHPGGAPLVGGSAPGRRGQGGRGDPGGEPDRRHDHLPELLPQVRQARGHDRHGPHRGHRVHEDLRAPGRRGPDQPGHGPPGPQRPDLQDKGRQVGRRRHADRGAPQARPAGARRHDLGRGLGAALGETDQARHQARGAERQARARRARGSDRRRGGPAVRRHDRDQHGRPWRRHQARRQRGAPDRAGADQAAACSPTRRSGTRPGTSSSPRWRRRSSRTARR